MLHAALPLNRVNWPSWLTAFSLLYVQRLSKSPQPGLDRSRGRPITSNQSPNIGTNIKHYLVSAASQ